VRIRQIGESDAFAAFLCAFGNHAARELALHKLFVFRKLLATSWQLGALWRSLSDWL
jgi:hypothetical protein